MIIQHSPAEILSYAQRALKWLQRKKDATETAGMLAEMALTIKANEAAIRRHIDSDPVPTESGSLIIGEIPPGIVTVAGVASTEEIFDLFKGAMESRRVVVYIADPAASSAMAFVIDLIRRRLQQLGWDCNVIQQSRFAIVPQNG